MDEESTPLRPGLPSSKAGADSGTLDRKRKVAGRDREGDKGQPAVEISRLRTEIDSTRHQLGAYVSELDRRRHEALDLKLQARRHPVLAIGAVGAVIGAVAGAVVLVTRARRREAAGRKLHRLLTESAPPPPPVPADPNRMLKLFLKAALPIGVSVLTKILTQRSSRRPPAA